MILPDGEWEQCLLDDEWEFKLQVPIPPELVLSKLVILPRHEVALFMAAPPTSDKLVAPQLTALFILVEGQWFAKSAKSSMLTIVVPDVWWTSNCFSSHSDDNADDMDMIKWSSKMSYNKFFELFLVINNPIKIIYFLDNVDKICLDLD